MWPPRDAYCRVCGQRLNPLGNCPMGCDQTPLPLPAWDDLPTRADMEPEEPKPYLKLMPDDDEQGEPFTEEGAPDPWGLDK